MQTIKPQYIKNEKGETHGVFLSEAEFDYLVEKRETLEEVSVDQEVEIEEEKTIPYNKKELKALIKATMIEVLVERRGWLMETFQEALEDLYLGLLMDEAKEGDYVSKEEVFATLKED